MSNLLIKKNCFSRFELFLALVKTETSSHHLMCVELNTLLKVNFLINYCNKLFNSHPCRT